MCTAVREGGVVADNSRPSAWRISLEIPSVNSVTGQRNNNG
ncbi:hypothetical protein [Chitinophaga nivalis]|uniref:Uncharacterized protein n=1 Tax=Chitinophaga nivalis TaxID=2991709 RepID=A0ABT3ILP8_9BACT|nr:hypothetical protein [Chitinophaga nivalis]MCW3465437.1 hypothetical protein [Chitinophaga nivalis]MCW3484871.1 hypothetical protein [Chitinophaga nivalis]